MNPVSHMQGHLSNIHRHGRRFFHADESESEKSDRENETDSGPCVN